MGTPQQIKAQLVDEYLVVDAADRAALRRELDRLALRYSDAGPFKVDLDGHAAQEVIRSISTPLTVLRTNSPTLEDAYLKIVGSAMEALE
jgi:hypothetical protein